jgi:hypothetical protein
MPRDVITLADVREPTLAIICELCGRRGRYNVERLIKLWLDGTAVHRKRGDNRLEGPRLIAMGIMARRSRLRSFYSAANRPRPFTGSKTARARRNT